MPNPELTLLDFLDQNRPIVIRYGAIISGKGTKTRLIPLTQIVKDSGLSRRLVQRLSQCSTWESVKIGVASKFIHACRWDVMHNQSKSSGKEKKMTRYYFLVNYIEKGLPHLTERQRKRFYDLTKWDK
jgi:hypothetical protein